MKNSQRNRDKILKSLEENPNLLRACKHAGVARSTAYRWMEDDIDFSYEVRGAQEIGQDNMSDYAEAKLFENIKNNQQKAIEFYLRHNNPKYASNRVESAYSEKRSIGRLAFLPTGVDQAHLYGELAGVESDRLNQNIENALGELYLSQRDPDEPVDIEKFSPKLAKIIYDLFPEAKDTFKEQRETYVKSKKMEN